MGVAFLEGGNAKVSSSLNHGLLQNYFAPLQRLQMRRLYFCFVNLQPRPPGSPVLTILKDQNFVNETIFLGELPAIVNKKIPLKPEQKGLKIPPPPLQIKKHESPA